MNDVSGRGERLEALAARCEAATGPDRELDLAIAIALNLPRKRNGAVNISAQVTASLDTAMTLVPKTAVNMSINQFGRGWNVRFHDTAQQMGERAAYEEIERMFPLSGSGFQIAGEPRVVLQKAIAEHWLEFYCPRAATPALALTAACLRAIAHQDLAQSPNIAGGGDRG